MGQLPAGITANILIPIDGSAPSSRAIDFAAEIGGPHAAYSLLHVTPVEPRVRDSSVRPGDQPTVQILAASALRDDSERLRALLPTATIETVLRNGDPAKTIVKEANTRSVSLIVMASRGRESADEQTYGSTVDRVVRTANVPVLVVRDMAGEVFGPTINRIVVPLDGSLRAAQAIPVAGRLARQLRVPVKFVTVIDPKRSFPPSLAYDAAQSGPYFEEILAGMRHELAFMLNREVKSMRRSGVEADAALVHGPTIQTIVGQTTPGDLMVMTSHGKGVGSHWLLGSISEKLLREARLPIVLLRSRPDPEVTVLAIDESLCLEPVTTCHHEAGGDSRR